MTIISAYCEANEFYNLNRKMVRTTLTGFNIGSDDIFPTLSYVALGIINLRFRRKIRRATSTTAHPRTSRVFPSNSPETFLFRVLTFPACTVPMRHILYVTRPKARSGFLCACIFKFFACLPQ